MKLSIKPKTKETPERKRTGPVPTIGGERMNYFPGNSLDGLEKLNALYTELKTPTITKSFVLREAAREWLKRKTKEAKEAKAGQLHAKRR